MSLLPIRPFAVQTDLVQTDLVEGDQVWLPAGTVTFLLTDVEGSSRLWEHRTGEMGKAISRHYELLDEVIARHHGVRPVEQGEGDSIVAAFARAGDALRAAVEAQRALSAELPWLPVRMAVHTGEAQLRDEGNYMGRAVIRCARLRSCGHGGQIVLSAAAAALVTDDPGDVELVDLGLVGLRDLSRAERVWQASAPGLPSRFPRLRSLDAARHNLPSVLTSFIGRERELAAVRALLGEERLITLTGSGGCGKTRLALHVAAEMVEDHPGGTWWVDLAPVTSASAVGEQVANAVGISTAPQADPAALVVRHLRDVGPTLLVVDNAEHVLDAVASLVDLVLAGCDGVRVLVTSREPLGLAGEVVWRVPSLPAPAAGEPVPPERLGVYDAARLFLDRARRVRPNLVIDDAAAAHVVAVCARLDGIPLALELAAVRARTLTLERLARGLDDAFRLLSGGARTALPRQQTLLASIAWSVDLLEQAERAVLRRLAVFRGSFALEAAEMVAADDGVVAAYDVLDLISRLVDKSLVQLDDTTGTYRLLETIRQYSLDQLVATGELASTRDRHCQWYAEWCESLGRAEHDFDIGPDHPALPDVFAALDWGYGAAPKLAYRISRGLASVRVQIGHYPAFDHQYDWLAGRDGHEDPRGWAAAVAGTAHMATVLGRASYLGLAARAEAMVDPDDVITRCHLRSYSASLTCLAGDASEMTELFTTAQRHGEDRLTWLVSLPVANTNANAGRLDAADEVFAVVRRMLAVRGLPLGHHTAPVIPGLAAFVAMLRGDLERARCVVDTPGQPDAMLIIANNAWAAMVGYVTADLALLDRLASWQATAEEALKAEVRATSEPAPLSGPALSVHWARAVIERRFVDALPLLRIAHAGTPTSPALRSYVLVPLVTRLIDAGEVGEAASLVEVLAADVDRLDDAPLPRCDLHYLRAVLARVAGDLDTAWAQAHRALEIAHPAHLRIRAVDDLHLLAVLAHERTQDRTAARLLAAVRTERVRIGYVACELPDRDGIDAIEAWVEAAQPDAWTEGATLGFAAAVEYAGRSRGQRSRPASGWASLTATEQRVAALVAQGHRNNEVADQLLMSVATVKTHLTHIYAKTGVTSRAKLAATLPTYLRLEPEQP